MKKNEWMTSFYGKPWHEVENTTDDKSLRDMRGLIEWRINVAEHEKLIKAQNLNFKIVESFIEFESYFKERPAYKEVSNIRQANEEDLDEILAITESCYAENPAFYSRFKNKRYFEPVQCKEYYRLSVLNSFSLETCQTVVSEDEAGITGYYMLKEIDDNKYKGMMTGVLPRARGQGLHVSMQHKCFSILQTPFVIVNTTQLNNFAIINNHIKENRKLSKIEHIFYLLLDD